VAKLLREMTEPDLKQYMQLLGQATKTITPQGSCFCVLIFDLHSPVVQYVGSVNRAEMIRAFRTAANQLEAHLDDPR
jgi:hypothetical protein